MKRINRQSIFPLKMGCCSASAIRRQIPLQIRSDIHSHFPINPSTLYKKPDIVSFVHNSESITLLPVFPYWQSPNGKAAQFFRKFPVFHLFPTFPNPFTQSPNLFLPAPTIKTHKSNLKNSPKTYYKIQPPATNPKSQIPNHKSKFTNPPSNLTAPSPLSPGCPCRFSLPAAT